MNNPSVASLPVLSRFAPSDVNNPSEVNNPVVASLPVLSRFAPSDVNNPSEVNNPVVASLPVLSRFAPSEVNNPSEVTDSSILTPEEITEIMNAIEEVEKTPGEDKETKTLPPEIHANQMPIEGSASEPITFDKLFPDRDIERTIKIRSRQEIKFRTRVNSNEFIATSGIFEGKVDGENISFGALHIPPLTNGYYSIHDLTGWFGDFQEKGFVHDARCTLMYEGFPYYFKGVLNEYLEPITGNIDCCWFKAKNLHFEEFPKMDRGTFEFVGHKEIPYKLTVTSGEARSISNYITLVTKLITCGSVVLFDDDLESVNVQVTIGTHPVVNVDIVKYTENKRYSIPEKKRYIVESTDVHIDVIDSYGVCTHKKDNWHYIGRFRGINPIGKSDGNPMPFITLKDGKTYDRIPVD